MYAYQHHEIAAVKFLWMKFEPVICNAASGTLVCKLRFLLGHIKVIFVPLYNKTPTKDLYFYQSRLSFLVTELFSQVKTLSVLKSNTLGKLVRTVDSNCT